MAATTEPKVVPHPSATSDAGSVNVPNYGGTGGSISRFITPGGHPLDTSQPAFPIFHRKLANPAPLGLFSFAGTTLVLSLYNAQARQVQHGNVVLGMALGYGGLAQIIAGIQEFCCGNTFGSTAFTSYGAFWLSFACLNIPSFGISTAYSSTNEYKDAVGMFLIVWGIITFFFFLGTFRSSVSLSLVFFFLFITFFLLGAGDMTKHVLTTKVGGGFGIVTALVAFYTGLSGLLTEDTSYFTVPVGGLARK